jgi:hypothetical protein
MAFQVVIPKLLRIRGDLRTALNLNYTFFLNWSTVTRRLLDEKHRGLSDTDQIMTVCK